MDTGDLELVRILIREAVDGIRLDFEGRLGLSTGDVDNMIYSHLEGVFSRLDALETLPEVLPEFPLIEPETPETVAQIVAAEAAGEVAIIEAEAEAAVDIIEAAADNDVPVVAVVTAPEGSEPSALEGDDETPPPEEFPEMAVIITPEGNVEEPAPKRGGFWNNPIIRGRSG